MHTLEGKKILVGVGGSIAAYRACDVIRDLRAAGATVTVAPTKGALAFVTALTFEALSGRAPLIDALEVEDGRIPHIEHAYETDLAVVVPASANLLARMANGIADEALLLTLLSVRAPLVIAPAMETRMWTHPATQKNEQVLRERGAIFVGPVEGPLASGREGKGRLAPVSDIVDACHAAVSKRDLHGKNVVVTAGPTAEDVDPVRFLTNRSSGKMGIALAKAAARRGANVTLVHGPLPTPPPSGAALGNLRTVAIRSAEDLCQQTTKASEFADLVILAAAVADYAPKDVATTKIKKTEGNLEAIALKRTPDTLATLVEGRGEASSPVIVGFAAETGDLETKARAKLARKKCDVICANDVAAEGIGFQSDDNKVTLFFQSGRDVPLPLAPKSKIAEWILDEVLTILPERSREGESPA